MQQFAPRSLNVQALFTKSGKAILFSYSVSQRYNEYYKGFLGFVCCLDNGIIKLQTSWNKKSILENDYNEGSDNH